MENIIKMDIRERNFRLLASRIYPDYEQVRKNTISGVHLSVKKFYAELYGSSGGALSTPLNASQPRFYLELTESGDYFMATANGNRKCFEGVGQIIHTETHSLLKLVGDFDEIVFTCLQVKISSKKKK